MLSIKLKISVIRRGKTRANKTCTPYTAGIAPSTQLHLRIRILLKQYATRRVRQYHAGAATLIPGVSSQQLRKHPPRELSPKYLRRPRLGISRVRSAKRKFMLHK